MYLFGIRIFSRVIAYIFTYLPLNFWLLLLNVLRNINETISFLLLISRKMHTPFLILGKISLVGMRVCATANYACYMQM